MGSRNILILVGILGLVSIFGIINSKLIFADSQNVSWSTGTPSVASNTKTPASTSDDYCRVTFRTYSEKVQIAGSDPINPALTRCYMGQHSGVEVLSVSYNGIAVKFPGDSRAYYTTMSCLYCNYLPDQDIFMTLESDNTASTGRIAVYRNFTQKLHRETHVQAGYHYYSVDTNSTEYISNFPGQPNYIGLFRHMMRSDNGRYVAAAMPGAGLFRIDMQTMELRKVSNWSVPSAGTQLEMSNDGRHIAVFGQWGANAVFELSENCGRNMSIATATEQDTQPYLTGGQECPSSNIASYLSGTIGVPQLSAIYNPRFNEDAGELLLTVVSDDYTYGSHDILLRAANYTPPQLDYLALGDSYSSGEGDTEKNPATNTKYYRDHTDVSGGQNTPREKCHISTRSYPYLLALNMNLTRNNPQQWDTVACSGAIVYDANSVNESGYEGQWSGQGDKGLGRLHGFSNKATLETQALNEMIPGRQKQIEFVKKYQPKVITLTMGGNNVDFGGKINACVGLTSPGTCNWAKLDWRNKLKNELKGQYDDLKSLYDDLKIASGNQAKIYVLGYPQFVNGSPTTSCQNTFNLDSDEREMIVNSVTYFNNVIEQAAKAAGVKYIDTETALGDHRLCDSGEKHVTAITGYMGWKGNEIQESFHPNAKGHQDITNKVVQQVDNQSLLTYDPCPNTTDTYCPDTSATKATIPNTTYFTITNEDDDKKFTYYQLSNGEFIKAQPGNVSALPYTYDPNVGLEVTVFSDPVSLGTVQPASDGSLDADITIPSTVPVGVHTLVLKGKTYSGEDIETYQTILVTGSDPDDLDDNGTPDSQQACGAFITPSGIDADYDGIDDACDPEITDPILYIARNGDSTKSEAPTKLYLYRNTRASSITGITTDYIDISSDPNNKEAKVAESLNSQTTNLIFNKFVMLEDSTSTQNPKPKIPTILAKDSTDQCVALQPTDYLSPALNPTNPNYTPRGFTTLTQLPEGEDCE